MLLWAIILIVLIYFTLLHLWNVYHLLWWRRPNIYFAIFSLAVGVGACYAVSEHGSKVPDSCIERDEYVTTLHVRLYPDPIHNNTVSYNMPVVISKTIEEVCDVFTDNGYQCRGVNAYYIHYATMPDGKRLLFKSESMITPNQYEWVYDNQGNLWGVELAEEPPQ